jgi:phage N-6-adenine-methyltransferase
MITDALFSSKTDVWETPISVFNRIERRFGPFDIDVCALPSNAKCGRYFTPDQDGLKQQWNGRCWCNPPYGRTIGKWIRKAWESSVDGSTVVMLIPARVDTTWWHDYVARYATVEFIRGRIRFGGSDNSAPFPSAIVVFRPNKMKKCPHCKDKFALRRIDAKYCSLACKQAAYRKRLLRVKP